MALMEISVVPLGTGSTSLGDYVARIVRLLEAEGVPFKLTDMGTIIEGDVGLLLELARKIHELPFEEGCQRVYTSLRIDDRRDKTVHLDDKIASVRERLSP
ncbi:MTH1187 family thiamine-binding protein [Thermosulfuriphilus sp.]